MRVMKTALAIVLVASPAYAIDLCQKTPGDYTETYFPTNIEKGGGEWTNLNKAKSEDGEFAHTINLDAGEKLFASAWPVCNPGAGSVITEVIVAVKSKVQYNSGQYGIELKLGIGTGDTAKFATTSNNWKTLDVTNYKSWTFDGLATQNVNLSLSKHLMGNNDSDVWVDAFRIKVKYTVPVTCNPNASQKCVGGALFWFDSCGKQGAMASNCDDADACTIDGCAGSNCTHSPDNVEANAACDAGALWAFNACGQKLGLKDGCDDNDSCTVDGCAGTACTHVADTVEHSQNCDGGQLWAFSKCGAKLTMKDSCDDGNACTEDGCAGAACTHMADTTEHSTGCVSGQLWSFDQCGKQLSLKDACDDSDACTFDACDEGTKACVFSPSSAPECCAPDGVACIGNKVHTKDTCGNITGVSEDCDDGDSCTVDGCEVDTCTHTAVIGPPCCELNVGTICDGNKLFNVDSCSNVGELIEDCNDGDPCTVDGCDVEAGGCTHISSGSPACECEPKAKMACKGDTIVWVDSCGNTESVADDCDDGDPCSDDGCDPGKIECIHTLIESEECKDVCIKFSTRTCHEGAVWWVDSCGELAEVLETCDDANVCTDDACDPEVVACAYLPNDACSECEPAQAAKSCNGGDVVWLDACGVQTSVIEACADGDVCTTDACDTSTWSCTHEPNPLPECAECQPNAAAQCDGDVSVSWVDSCGIVGAVLALCDDGDPCTADGCDEKTATCVHLALPDCEPTCAEEPTSSCLDGALVWLDACGEVAGLADACVDDDTCTVDSCDAGACAYEPSEQAECVEKVDPCEGSVTTCKGVEVVEVDLCGAILQYLEHCDDGDACTLDTCDDAAAACVYVPIDSADCTEDTTGDATTGGATTGDATTGDATTGGGTGGDTAADTTGGDTDGSATGTTDGGTDVAGTGGDDAGCGAAPAGRSKAAPVLLLLLLGALWATRRQRLT